MIKHEKGCGVVTTYPPPAMATLFGNSSKLKPSSEVMANSYSQRINGCIRRSQKSTPSSGSHKNLTIPQKKNPHCQSTNSVRRQWITFPGMFRRTARPPVATKILLAVNRFTSPPVCSTATVCGSTILPPPSYISTLDPASNFLYTPFSLIISFVYRGKYSKRTVLKLTETAQGTARFWIITQRHVKHHPQIY